MKLSKLLEHLSVDTALGDIDISDITSDSRTVKPGCAFVCVKFRHFDGHNAAGEAEAKGAAVIIAEHDTGAKNQVILKDTRAAWSLMCQSFFGNPSEKLKLIGITGTNGKTTVSFLMKEVLEFAGKSVGLVGTIQNMVNDTVYPASFTTPDAYELQELFSRMVEAGCEYCVMEVSSQALAQGRVAGCRFDTAVFTNLTQDHLDYHGTMQAYKEAKQLLFRQTEKAVLNLDDGAAMEMVEGADCGVITYAMDTDASDYTAKNVRFRPEGIEYELVGKGMIGRVHCPIPGRFSVYNSMAVAVCALEQGIDFMTVLQALEVSKGVKGRIEVVPTPGDCTVMIDYAHSPDGLMNILTSAREIAKGRLVVLFGCGGDRDKGKRPQMGKIAAELADYCIVTSDNPRSEDPDAIIRDILQGMKDTKTPYDVIVNRREAIHFALSSAEPEDLIILAGKGHETYQILDTGKIHFDEREAVADFYKKN